MAAGGAGLGGPGDVFTGGEPLWEQNRLTAGDFSRIFEQNWRSFFRWSNVDAVYRGALRWMTAVARAVAVPVTWLESHALAAVLAGAGGMVVVAGMLSPAGGVHVANAVAPMPALLIGACCLASVALVCAAAEASDDRWLPLQIGILACFALAGMMAGSEGVRFGCLETAAILSAWPVWRSARSLESKVVFLSAMVISGGLLAASQWVSAVGAAGWGRALLLTSVCLKFAAIPFCFWLLRLADELPAGLLGFVLAVVDMAAVGELLQRAQGDPGMFAPRAAWWTIAVLTSLAAALLMLAQRNVKRLLVLSSLEDIGFLMLGISSLSTLGESGVVMAAASHAMAKSLLFLSIASPECEHALCEGASGLAVRYPFSAFGFLAGMLAMLGAPPLLGYSGRWRLYEAALAIHPLLLAGFVVASVLALIAYVNAFSGLWWGVQRGCPPAGDSAHWHYPALKREAFLVRAGIVLLSLALLAAGLWPNWMMQILEGGRP